MRSGDFHSMRPVWRDGQMLTAFTGNVLFRRAFVERNGLRFRIELGNTGGEDEDFFDRFREAGEQIGFAPAAVCYESVPPERANLAWLLRRRFRAGQSHGARLGRTNSKRIHIAVALAKAGYCSAGVVFAASSPLHRNRHLIRGALHCGTAARLAGIGEIRMY
jgi:succinoglycan biosynthesis protein ExoM